MSDNLTWKCPRCGAPAEAKTVPSETPDVQRTDVRVEDLTYNVGIAVMHLVHSQSSPLEDLHSAKWYLEREIARLEKLEKLE